MEGRDTRLQKLRISSGIAPKCIEISKSTEWEANLQEFQVKDTVSMSNGVGVEILTEEPTAS